MTGMLHIYQIGAFRLNARTGELTRDGVPVPVGGRALRVLAALVARPGELVTKDQLMAAAWPGMLVGEANIPVQINLLRRWLDDGRKTHGQIVTVPGRGYRFAGEVLHPETSAPDERPWPPALPPQAARHEDLIGREHELARLHASLARHRLVTLTGTGGIGKTRLAAEFAAEFLADPASRLVFLPLEDIRQGGELAARLATALGLPASAEPEKTLVAALRRRGDFLVLDNCEHVLADAAALATTILAQTDRTKILATSREPLGLPDEVLLPLGPLELPERDSKSPALPLADYAAIKTFAAAARASGARLDITTATAAPIEKICRRLEGIPLALKLAGARLATHSLAALEQTLDAQWRLPAATHQNLPARQRTMEAAIAWSVALLEPPAQTFLLRLGAFAGSFSVPAAQALAPDGVTSEQAAEMLDSLITKSLAVALPALTTSRFRLLEPVRDFTRRHIGQPEEVHCRMKLLRYFGALYEQSIADYRFMNTDEWLSRYGDDQANVDDLLDWALLGAGAGRPGVAAAALHLHQAVSQLFTEQSRLYPYNRWANATLALINESTPPLQKARTLHALASGQTMSSGRNEAFAREAAGIFRQLGDRARLGQALMSLAQAIINPADVVAAEQYLAEAETSLRAVHDKRNLASCLGFRSVCREQAGDLPGAERLAAECLALAREIGCRRITLEAGAWQVTLAYRAGRHAEAIRLARARIAECRAQRQLAVEFYLIQQLMSFLLQTGEPKSAEALLPEALDSYAGSMLEIFALHVAACLARRGAWAHTARLVGFIDAWRRNQERKVLDRDEKWSFDTLQKLLAEGADAEDCRNWRAEGALWDEAEALAYLRGIADET